MMNLKQMRLSGCVLCLMILIGGCVRSEGAAGEDKMYAATESGWMASPFEHLYIGFYSNRADGAAAEKADLIQAMMNCGMCRQQLIVPEGNPPEKAIEMLLNQCQLIIISADLKHMDIAAIAAAYPDTQFVIQGKYGYTADNMITYGIDHDKIHQFIHEFEAHMIQRHIPDYEQYLDYEISYTAIFEEVITIFAEMQEVRPDAYYWSADEGCVEFTNIQGKAHEFEVMNLLNEMTAK